MSREPEFNHSIAEETLGRVRAVRSKQTAVKIVELLEEQLPVLREEILSREHDLLPADTSFDTQHGLRISKD